MDTETADTNINRSEFFTETLLSSNGRDDVGYRASRRIAVVLWDGVPPDRIRRDACSWHGGISS